jgi:hypothetical protein
VRGVRQDSGSALAQSWQLERDDTQAEVEVEPELAALDRLAAS